MAMAFGLRLSLIAFSVIAFDGLLRGGTFEDTVRLALIVGGVFLGAGVVNGRGRPAGRRRKRRSRAVQSPNKPGKQICIN